MVGLSALVCVRDEEARLAACLDRLAFCDEIVVVADRCRDGSEALARAAGARVVSGDFPLEGERKAAGVAACAGDWILEIDADELVSAALAREVREVISAGPPPTAAYFQIPVDNYIGDRLVRRGWGGSFGTSKVGRLYRRGLKSWAPQRVHPSVTFHGALGGELRTPLVHVVDEDVADVLARLNRYTDLRAQDLAESGRRLGVGDNLFRGLRRFWKCYWTRGGWREGELGLLIALMAGLYPVLSCLKARELRRRPPSGAGELAGPGEGAPRLRPAA